MLKGTLSSNPDMLSIPAINLTTIGMDIFVHTLLRLQIIVATSLQQNILYSVSFSGILNSNHMS